MSCPSENQLEIDQSRFWDENGLHWTTHRIGWAIAGGCAVLTFLISLFTVLSHCRNYTNPPQQRQILRILYMPPVYAVISFSSYRFFRQYTYYSFIQIAYEAIGISAFLLLLIEYVGSTAVGNSAEKALERKDKRPLPIPFCFWRYRPTKAYFMYTVKWSVLQYVIIRPVVSITGIICERLGVLCHSAGFSPKWASVYLESINFVSISIALYGLLVFYGLTAEELRSKRPMAKFLAIKLIVMFTFYQSFVFSALEGRVIHSTTYWTETNIANGLNALAVCIEMVFFSFFMAWAYTPNDYKKSGVKTSVWKPLWDSINYADFAAEIAGSFRYYWSSAVNKNKRPDLAEAFGVEGHDTSRTRLSPNGGGVNARYTPAMDRSPVFPNTPLGGRHVSTDSEAHIPLNTISDARSMESRRDERSGSEEKYKENESLRYSTIGLAR